MIDIHSAIEAPRDVPPDFDWLQALQRVADPGEIRDALAAGRAPFRLENLSQVAVLGAADEGRRFLRLFGDHGIRVSGLFDGSAALHGKRVDGMTVRPASDLAGLGGDVPIVLASHRVLVAADFLNGLKAPWATAALLQVMYPGVFPPHMFYDGLIEDLVQNRERYRELATLFADSRSRRVLNAVIGFRLTLDPEILRPVVEGDAFQSADLMKFSDDEVYVDAGAYDGDTVRRFISRVGGRFRAIYAFEPDQATFPRLAEAFRDDPRIKAMPLGISRRSGALRFAGTGGRGSAFSDDGGIVVPVAGIDEVLDGSRVSYIKMNIEGAEIDALDGARASIGRWRPKLAISAYHRPSHLREVPLLIREIEPGYRLYLRQQDGGIIETVVYGLPGAAKARTVAGAAE